MTAIQERLSTPSMQVAAARLRKVSAQERDHGWVAEARGAVRAAILAVEQELGEVGGTEGFGRQVIEQEPRLMMAIERLEAGLAEALLALWQVKEDVDSPEDAARLAQVARKLEELANTGFGLAYESLISPSAMD